MDDIDADLEEVIRKAEVGNWTEAFKLYKDLQYIYSLEEFKTQLKKLNTEKLYDLNLIAFIALGKEIK